MLIRASLASNSPRLKGKPDPMFALEERCVSVVKMDSAADWFPSGSSVGLTVAVLAQARN